MSVGAEYMYKQGRIHMSLDSNLTVRSSLDTNVSPGMNLQLVTELSQLNQQAKFGTSLMMG